MIENEDIIKLKMHNYLIEHVFRNHPALLNLVLNDGDFESSTSLLSNKYQFTKIMYKIIENERVKVTMTDEEVYNIKKKETSSENDSSSENDYLYEYYNKIVFKLIFPDNDERNRDVVEYKKKKNDENEPANGELTFKFNDTDIENSMDHDLFKDVKDAKKIMKRDYVYTPIKAFSKQDLKDMEDGIEKNKLDKPDTDKGIKKDNLKYGIIDDENNQNSFLQPFDFVNPLGDGEWGMKDEELLECVKSSPQDIDPEAIEALDKLFGTELYKACESQTASIDNETKVGAGWGAVKGSNKFKAQYENRKGCTNVNTAASSISSSTLLNNCVISRTSTNANTTTMVSVKTKAKFGDNAKIKLSGNTSFTDIDTTQTVMNSLTKTQVQDITSLLKHTTTQTANLMSTNIQNGAIGPKESNNNSISETQRAMGSNTSNVSDTVTKIINAISVGVETYLEFGDNADIELTDDATINRVYVAQNITNLVSDNLDTKFKITDTFESTQKQIMTIYSELKDALAGGEDEWSTLGTIVGVAVVLCVLYFIMMKYTVGITIGPILSMFSFYLGIGLLAVALLIMFAESLMFWSDTNYSLVFFIVGGVLIGIGLAIFLYALWKKTKKKQKKDNQLED